MHTLLNKLSFVALIISAFSLSTRDASAQHSDIELGYEGGKIIVDVDSAGRVFTGDFATSGLFEQSSSNPGFATNADEGLVVNSLDVIDYNILGPLTYHNGISFAAVPAGASITISDNPAGSLVVDAMTMGPISGPRFIGQASSSGSVHSHIDFELNPRTLDSLAYGAYGLLMELTTDEPGIANSDPFYIVFNFGLESSQFERAVGHFAAQVPEPGSLVLAGLGTIAASRLRRRRVVRS